MSVYDTLRELVAWQAPPETPVLSLYLDLSEHDADRDAAAEVDDLLDDHPWVDDAFRTRVEERLAQLPHDLMEAATHGHEGLALFLSVDPPLDVVVGVHFPLEPIARVGRDPFLRPLLTLDEEYEPALVAVLADEPWLGEVHVGGLEDTCPLELTERHTLAGDALMQVRRRLRDDARTHLIVAGPPEERAALVGRLPADLRSRLVGELDRTWLPDGEGFLQAVHRVLQQRERRVEAEAVALLREHRGEATVAVGPAETLAALNRGKIQKLLILQDLTLFGWLCDSCSQLGLLPEPPVCTACGASVTEVALDEHVLDQAAACGAEIETVYKSKELAEMGGLGALVDLEV